MKQDLRTLFARRVKYSDFLAASEELSRTRGEEEIFAKTVIFHSLWFEEGILATRKVIPGSSS